MKCRVCQVRMSWKGEIFAFPVRECLTVDWSAFMLKKQVCVPGVLRPGRSTCPMRAIKKKHDGSPHIPRLLLSAALLRSWRLSCVLVNAAGLILPSFRDQSSRDDSRGLFYCAPCATPGRLKLNESALHYDQAVGVHLLPE